MTQEVHWWFRVWYSIVYHTKHSRAFMATFSVACLGVPYGLYRLSTWATNPEVDALKVAELKRQYNASLSQEMLAKANRDRLGQLLHEVQTRGDDARYAAALECGPFRL
uniref:Uncharacterized protein n=1 Tax=Tetraselmis sp. GSL018 TaxID=582737 RepID=A0A061S5U0_9CHLO|mmetsp:Transcript_37278/g.88599  ORF Transcript_37278/g.88599 Transcript_37278/m.88599 type:complete len:109 (+) Transcript_37278:306-632(+)